LILFIGNRKQITYITESVETETRLLFSDF